MCGFFTGEASLVGAEVASTERAVINNVTTTRQTIKATAPTNIGRYTDHVFMPFPF
jgi:hypothetical protein